MYDYSEWVENAEKDSVEYKCFVLGYKWYCETFPDDVENQIEPEKTDRNTQWDKWYGFYALIMTEGAVLYCDNIREQMKAVENKDSIEYKKLPTQLDEGHETYLWAKHNGNAMFSYMPEEDEEEKKR